MRHVAYENIRLIYSVSITSLVRTEAGTG